MSMNIKFFGQFLVDRGWISTEQLRTAMAHDDALSLGNLAVAKGMVSPENAKKIVALAHRSQLEFGQAAPKAGGLSEDQVGYLQYLQKSDIRRLCSSLLDCRFLDEAP